MCGWWIRVHFFWSSTTHEITNQQIIRSRFAYLAMSTSASTSTSFESPEIDSTSQSPINCSQYSSGSVYSPQKHRVKLEDYSFEDDDESSIREIRIWQQVYQDEKQLLLTQQHSHFSWIYPTKDGNVSRCTQHEDCDYLIRISRGMHIYNI